MLLKMICLLIAALHLLRIYKINILFYLIAILKKGYSKIQKNVLEWPFILSIDNLYTYITKNYWIHNVL